ncbi:UDP-glucuronic acid decarboxylase family protein [Idiomarina abyssalis]|uniref:UDP-glucuronic acid decarboxylase family protein n=1 Tax=Idiomarina abyssalis TaxID=86102 RepID=UPI003A903F5E
MSKILVTGGAGFLGSHLCDALLAQGHEVTCLDSFYTGSLSNIAHLQSETRFKCIEADVQNKIDGDFDEIYNLACPASPVHYQKDPIYTFKTSVLGAMNVLDLAVRTGARVFQASTSEVYGDPVVHPQPESYWGNVNPIGIRSCYDEGKRAAETLFFDYQRMFGVDIKVVRIFNTYGPRMDSKDGRVVSNFIIQALRDEDITIYGDGTQTRSFCFYSDLIDGFIKLMNSGNDIKGPVNIGNPGEFTMLELAKKIVSITESKSQIRLLPLPEDDPKQRKPDITIATDKLGWKPNVNLDSGLRKTISYFSQQVKFKG